MGIAKPIKIIATLATASLLMGCQALQHTSSLAAEDAESTVASSAPAYYYFSAAQIKLKKGDVNEAIWYIRQALKYDKKSTFLRLELANLYLIKKEDTLALAQIEEVLDHHPNQTQALIIAGRIYQQRDDSQSAKAVFEKVLAHKPDEQQIYLLLGRIYWKESDLKNTVRVFKKMVSHFPDDYTSYYFYGKSLAALGKLDKAEQALLQSLVLEPTLREPREELLRIYKIQNQTEKVAALYHEMLEIDPTNPMHALGLAEHLHGHGDDDTALKLLFDLGRQVEDNRNVIPAVFDSYIEPKKYEMALWVLTAMLEAVPDNSDLNYLAGVSASGLARDALALEHLAKVKPASRFYQNAVVQSAIIHHDTGNINHAIVVIQQAILGEPDNPDYYLYLGSFYEELERYDDALKSLKQGVAVDDSNPRLHFRIGLIYDKMGRKQASIKSMRQVIQLAPNDAEALNYLGYTYADMGINLEEAESLIQSALKIRPDDGYITDSLGWVYYKQGLYSEALHWLKKAFSLVPDDPTILEHLGDVYLKLNSQQKALNFYKRSLEKDDKNRDLLKQKIRSLNPE